MYPTLACPCLLKIICAKCNPIHPQVGMAFTRRLFTFYPPSIRYASRLIMLFMQHYSIMSYMQHNVKGIAKRISTCYNWERN